MDPVVHFQMPAEDRDRMARFYEQAFGWQTQKLGEEMGGYTLATTTPNGPDGRPAASGAINGGFFARPADGPGRGTHIVIAVQDVEGALRAVSQAGGTVTGQPEEIPGVGRFATFLDTEGNHVSMLQPNPPAGS